MKKLLLAATLLVSAFSVTTFATTADEFPDHFNPNYSEAEATAKDDAQARKVLKKAYESVYSPRAAGLEAFHASLEVSVKAPEVKGQQIKFPPMTVQAEIDWSKNSDEINVTLITNADATAPKNPIMAMLKTGIERVLPQLAPELLDGVIGLHSFDNRFENTLISQENETTIRVDVKDSDDELTSHLATLEGGQVSSIDMSSLRFAFEYKKASDKVVLTKFAKTLFALEEDRFGDLEITEALSEYTLSDHEDVGDYTFATRAATEIDYSGFKFNIVGTLSGIKVDDDAADNTPEDTGEEEH